MTLCIVTSGFTIESICNITVEFKVTVPCTSCVWVNLRASILQTKFVNLSNIENHDVAHVRF